MKPFITVITAVLLSVVLLLGACSKSNSETAWLHGTWNLTHNPAMDEEDTLVFKSDGSMEIITKRGGRIPGVYQINGRTLNLSLNAGRKLVESSFAISADKSQLVYSNGAYYTKEK